jgi:hypothetical protein
MVAHNSSGVANTWMVTMTRKLEHQRQRIGGWGPIAANRLVEMTSLRRLHGVDEPDANSAL